MKFNPGAWLLNHTCFGWLSSDTEELSGSQITFVLSGVKGKKTIKCLQYIPLCATWHSFSHHWGNCLQRAMRQSHYFQCLGKTALSFSWFWNISIKPVMVIINTMGWDFQCCLLCCHVPVRMETAVGPEVGGTQHQYPGGWRGSSPLRVPHNLRLSFSVEPLSKQGEVQQSFSAAMIKQSHITYGTGWQGQWIQISFNCGGPYCHCLSIRAFELGRICSVHSVKWCIQLNALEFMIFSQG